MNQRGARIIAEDNLRGQGVLATDHARREWLIEATRGFLAVFPERQLKYHALITAAVGGAVADAVAILRDREMIRELLAFSSLWGLDDAEVNTAFRACVDGESAQLLAARKLVVAAEQGQTKAELAKISLELDPPAHNVGVAIDQIRRVLAALMFADPS